MHGLIFLHPSETGSANDDVYGFSHVFKTGVFILKMCVVHILRMYVRIYRRLPAHLGLWAQLGLAHHHHLENSPSTPLSHLQGNSPTIPPSQPLRALPPFPAICLPTWTQSMLSHGLLLTWVENSKLLWEQFDEKKFTYTWKQHWAEVAGCKTKQWVNTG